MSLLAVGLSALAVAFSLFAAARAFVVSKDRPGPEIQPYDDGPLKVSLGEVREVVGALHAQYAEIGDWRDDLTIAVAEGVKHVDRAENRIRATVRRAREQLEEHGLSHGALDSEARELRLVDGGEREGRGVREVPEDVEDDSGPSGLPGRWTQEQLRAVRNR